MKSTFYKSRKSDAKLESVHEPSVQLNSNQHPLFGTQSPQKYDLKESLIKKLATSLPQLGSRVQRSSDRIVKREQMSEIEMRAKNYLFKYKIVNDPFTTFSLVNIILEERQKLLDGLQQNKPAETNKQNNQKQTKFLPNITAKTQSKLPIHENREEVLNLAKWLDSKIDKLRKKDTLELHDILEYKQSVINLAVGEIVRMVSNTCKERGRLLKMVFDSTFEIFQNIVALLLKYNNGKEEDSVTEQKNLKKMYEERIRNQLQEKQKATKQLDYILENFKKLIISTRKLKKQKKMMELQHKLNEYSLQSYREGYSVALEMALQSADKNILNWANKILSKLIRDKKQKHNNSQKAAADNEMFMHAKDVVFNWLRRNVSEYKPEMFEKYQELDLVENYEQLKKDRKFAINNNVGGEECMINESKKHRIKNISTIIDRETNQINISKIKRYQGDQNRPNCNIQNKDENELNQSLSESEQQVINIYDYFKCYDVGTSMEIAYANQGVGNHFETNEIAVQTQTINNQDCQVQVDNFDKRADTRANVIEEMPGFDDTITNTENFTISKSHKNKKRNSKARSKDQDSAYSLHKFIHRNDSIKQHTNIVNIKSKHNRRKAKQLLVSKGELFEEANRSNSLFFIPDSSKRIPRDLELRKFAEIFQRENSYLMKNTAGFIQSVQERRSFYMDHEVEYSNAYGVEKKSQVKVIFKKKYNNPKMSIDMGEVSKKIKVYLEKIVAASNNVMKQKTFKQNLQIFNIMASEIKEVKIRQQKIPSTLNVFCKVFSSLILDYVKSIKRDKEDKVEEKTDKFIYPLNVLYVDRFIHTYGLKDIAEKNMKNTLSIIIGLIEKSEKMKLFYLLLGVEEKQIGGDQLLLYIKCLVYFDTSGKVSLNQATMKDFNIDRLTTDRMVIKECIGKVCEGFLEQQEIEDVLKQIMELQVLTIEAAAIIIILYFQEKRMAVYEEYLPLYSYLCRNNQFIVNLLEFIQYLRLGPDREIEIVKYFSNNLDLVDENVRLITVQHFVSCCIKLKLPTITEMSEFFLRKLKELPLSEELMATLSAVKLEDMELVNKIKKCWKMNIELALTQDIELEISNGNQRMADFWWRYKLNKLMEANLYEHINTIVGSLNTISLEVYSSLYKRTK